MSERGAVWKFDLPVQLGEPFKVDMPAHHESLAVQVQRGMPRLWAVVDPDPGAVRALQEFMWLGTGHEVPPELDARFNGSYVGTVQLHGGELVLHLFELESKS